LNNNYIEYQFHISPLQPATDILIAELSEVDFESFVETPTGVLAYIKKKDWKEKALEGISILSNTNFKISHSHKEIKETNWNAVWEADFNPIQIGTECVVRASFHDVPKVTYDIVITPRMSFGTGHHETTHMMLQHILDLNCANMAVLDMGCGTGVLAILAAMRGANTIDAIDIDPWCYKSTSENAVTNGCDHIKAYQGDVAILKDQKYDLILANINRNILLEQIPAYAKHLRPKGILLLSGFYTEDLPKINAACLAQRLKFEKNLEKNNWVSSKYVF